MTVILHHTKHKSPSRHLFMHTSNTLHHPSHDIQKSQPFPINVVQAAKNPNISPKTHTSHQQMHLHHQTTPKITLHLQTSNPILLFHGPNSHTPETLHHKVHASIYTSPVQSPSTIQISAQMTHIHHSLFVYYHQPRHQAALG